MYQRILVPLDGSLLAEEALPHAIAIARAQAGEVLLFRVAVSSLISDAMVSLEQGNPELRAYAVEVEEPVYESAQHYLEGVRRSLERQGIRAQIVVKHDADPATAILDYAREAGVDLIVMSTHGRSGLRRLIYGSVTERVLRSVGVPVLVIPSGGWKSAVRS